QLDKLARSAILPKSGAAAQPSHWLSPTLAPLLIPRGQLIMHRSSAVRLGLLAVCFAALFAIGVPAQNVPPATLRARANKLKTDGNFREAYDLFRRLCLDVNAGPAITQDLHSAVECLNQL